MLFVKDYSKFIQSSYGFITKYVVEKDQLFVYTTENEKNKPHVYSVTKDSLKYIDERLENQYMLVLKNRKLIEDDYSKNVCDKIIKGGEVVLYTLLAIMLFVSGLLNAVWPLISGLFFGACIFISSTLFADYKRRKFKEHLDLCQDYLNNRENLSKKRANDSNVIRNLSCDTLDLIEKKEKQKDMGLIENAFDVDLMDKMQLEDLRRLLIDYRICEGIKSEQTFVNIPEDKKLIKKKNKRK